MSLEVKDPTVSEPCSSENPTEASTQDRAPGSLATAERRREPRYACHDPAEVRIISGDAGRMPAIVSDISRSGMQLEIETPLKKGLAIEVALPREVIVSGRVRYCRRAGQAFHAGILIDDVSYGSRADDGNHLLDDDLRLYVAKTGLTAAKVLGARDHIRRCRLCAARYEDARRMAPRAE